MYNPIVPAPVAPVVAINSPRDPASGLPTGKRCHQPAGIIAILIGL